MLLFCAAEVQQHVKAQKAAEAKKAAKAQKAAEARAAAEQAAAAPRPKRQRRPRAFYVSICQHSVPGLYVHAVEGSCTDNSNIVITHAHGMYVNAIEGVAA